MFQDKVGEPGLLWADLNKCKRIWQSLRRPNSWLQLSQCPAHLLRILLNTGFGPIWETTSLQWQCIWMNSSPSTTTADVTKVFTQQHKTALVCSALWNIIGFQEMEKGVRPHRMLEYVQERPLVAFSDAYSAKVVTSKRYNKKAHWFYLNRHEQCLKGCWSSWFGTYHLWTSGVDSQHRWNHVSITKEVVIFSRLFLSIFNTDMKNKLHPTTSIFFKEKRSLLAEHFFHFGSENTEEHPAIWTKHLKIFQVWRKHPPGSRSLEFHFLRQLRIACPCRCYQVVYICVAGILL